MVQGDRTFLSHAFSLCAGTVEVLCTVHAHTANGQAKQCQLGGSYVENGYFHFVEVCTTLALAGTFRRPLRGGLGESTDAPCPLPDSR